MIKLDAWMAIAVAGGSAIWLTSILSTDVIACDAELVTLAEPSGWRDWTLEEGLGGFTVTGEPTDRKYALGFINTELRDGGLCPGRGVSVDAWFPGTEHGTLYGSLGRLERELRVRRHDDVWAISGQEKIGDDERFVVAFRRDAGPRLVFVPERSRSFAVALSSVLVMTLSALAFAAHATRRARSYEDRRVYTPGTRDARGWIALEDGSPLVAPIEDGKPHEPGPVLVRVAGTVPATYRDAPVTRARTVLTGSASQLREATLASAKLGLSFGSRMALTILVLTGIARGFMAIGEAFKDFY